MALGLIGGLLYLTGRGVGTVSNSIKDDKARQRTDNGTTYKDRNGRTKSSATGNNVDVAVLKRSTMWDSGWLYGIKVIGEEAYEGDKVWYDTKTKRIIKNLSAQERTPEAIKKQEEATKKWWDKNAEYSNKIAELKQQQHQISEDYHNGLYDSYDDYWAANCAVARHWGYLDKEWKYGVEKMKQRGDYHPEWSLGGTKNIL